MFTIRARRDDVDRRVDQLLDARQIGLRIVGQLIVARRADGGFGPARHILVDGLTVRKTVNHDRHALDRFAVNLVADGNPHRFQAIEHVELRDAEPGHAAVDDRAA